LPLKPPPYFQAHNIRHFRTLAEADYVEIIPMKDAVDMLSTFKVKTVNPTPVFRGELLLGDAAAHPLESLSVPVFMYARTYEAKLPTAKKWSALSDMNTGEQPLTHDVGKEVSYKIKGSNKQANGNGNGDSEAQTAESDLNGSAEASTSKGVTEQGNINSYDLEHAYPFGKSLVVITEEDEKFMKIETKAGMFILGFLSASSV
jgi:ATP-dependent DNA helicase 2 subunit 2